MYNRDRLILWSTFVFVGFITTIILLFFHTPEYFSLLPIIPLTYTLLYLLFPFILSKSFFSGIFGIMYTFILFLRAIVMPLLLAIGGFVSTKPLNIENNMPIAILLFAYELVVEFIVISIMFKNNQNSLSIAKKHEIQQFNYTNLVILVLATLAVTFVLAPNAIHYYRTIFGITNLSYTGFNSNEIITASATTVLSKFGIVTFRYIANVARIIIPALFILSFKKHSINKSVALLLTIILIFIFNFLIVDDTIASSLVNATVLIIFYNKYYGNSKEVLRYFVYVGILAILYFYLRISLTSEYSSNLGVSTITRFSNYFQAYFSGLNNISAGLNINIVSFGEKLKYAIYEVLKGIPYAHTIFGLDSTNISNLFNSVNSTTGQIIPSIISGTIYFGPIFGPLYTILFVFIAYKFGLDIKNNKKPLRTLSSIAICIYALMGISMYSPEATWAFIFTIGVAIRLLSFIFERNAQYNGNINKSQKKVFGVY